MQHRRDVVCLFAFALLIAAACAHVTTTQALAPADVFSITYVAGGKLHPWSRADIYVRLPTRDSQYVGTIDVDPAHGQLVGTSHMRTRKLAVSNDGRSIVFHHDRWRAPRNGKFANGVYPYSYGSGIKMLYGTDTVGSAGPVHSSMYATPQGPFPADVLPFVK